MHVALRPLVLIVALVALLVACGGAKPASETTAPEPAPATKILVNVDSLGVGLGGYDPISYTQGDAPVAGDRTYPVTYGGATYHFTSAANQGAFAAAPDQHQPAFGGFCAYAAAEGRLSPADPTQFLVHDGHLLVFTNEDFRTRFLADPDGNLARANASWPALVEQHGTN